MNKLFQISFDMFVIYRSELAKPANTLYAHNISSILETAIRATSTKLEELDVQRRVDIRILSPSENETGWDIFSLDYNVDGPIGTVSTHLVKKEFFIFVLINNIICLRLF